MCAFLSSLMLRILYAPREVRCRSQFACNSWSAQMHAVRPARNQAPQRDDLSRAWLHPFTGTAQNTRLSCHLAQCHWKKQLEHRWREEGSQTRPVNKRSRHESVTNTYKEAAKLGNLHINVTQATVLRRTSPPVHGARCPAKERAGRCGTVGDVPHLNHASSTRRSPAQKRAAQGRQS